MNAIQAEKIYRRIERIPRSEPIRALPSSSRRSTSIPSLPSPRLMDPLPLVIRRIPLRPKPSRLKPPAHSHRGPTSSPLLVSPSLLSTRRSTPSPPSSRNAFPSSPRHLHSARSSAGLPPAVKALTAKLGESQPCFPIRGDEIQVLSEPEEFFKALLVRASLEYRLPLRSSSAG